MKKQIFQYDVFLSHNSKDKLFVETLAEKLEDDGHIRLFLDKWHLISGQQWIPALEQAMRDSRTVAVFVGPGGDSPWRENEMQIAMVLNGDNRERSVIPVLLPGVTQNDIEKLNLFLKTYTWVDFRGGVYDESAFADFLNAINQQPRGRRKYSIEKLSLPNPGAKQSGWRLDFPRNQIFTGRESALVKLSDELLEQKTFTLLITQTVSGMGGVGKTQLAVEFCYRYGRYFSGVHWLNLQDPEQFDKEVAICGTAMGLSLPEDNLPKAVQMTLEAWALPKSQPHLLIFDNLEDETALRKIQVRLKGDLRILLTARKPEWSRDIVSHTLSLDVFAPNESKDYLIKELSNKITYTQDELEKLGEKLGYRPLALHLAARYIARLRLTITNYLQHLDNVLDDPSLDNWLLGGETPTAHSRSLKATFKISWEMVTEEKAQILFKLMAWCAPNVPIPLGLLKVALEQQGKITDDNAGEIILREGILKLENAGLISYGDRELMPHIHPLLSEYGRGLDEKRIAMLQLAIGMTRESSRLNATGLPSPFIPLIPHMESLLSHIESNELDSAPELHNNLGSHYGMIADYEKSQFHYERALKILESNNLLEHPYYAITLNNKGLLLREMGELDKSIVFLKQALEIGEKTLGTNHSDVAIWNNNMGNILRDMGHPKEAKEYLEKALQSFRVNFGESHINVAITINSLGLLAKSLGEYGNARKCFEQAIAIGENTLNSEHPSMAVWYSNLGNLLRDVEDFEKAQYYLERALEISKKTLGDNHPTIALRLNNLGLLCQALGEVQKAQNLYDQALLIAQTTLPEKHPQIEAIKKNIESLTLY